MKGNWARALSMANRVPAVPSREIGEAFIRRHEIEVPATASQLPSRHHQPIKAPVEVRRCRITELHRSREIRQRANALPV